VTKLTLIHTPMSYSMKGTNTTMEIHDKNIYVSHYYVSRLYEHASGVKSDEEIYSLRRLVSLAAALAMKLA
jgi:hypothetical protein